MDFYDKPSPSECLAHYGVLGMKWGVRKDRYKDYYDRDQVLKKGQKIQTVTSGQKASLDRKYTYVSQTAKDNSFYNSYLAEGYKALTNNGKVYSNEFLVKSDIRIPSQQKAVSDFLDLYRSDPKGVAECMARGLSARRRTADMGKAQLKMLDRQEKKLYKQASKDISKGVKRGEEWLAGTGYSMFSFGFGNVENPARDKYFDTLFKQGFGGVRDVNDIDNGYTDNPLIVFRPSSSLANAGCKELTARDIELGKARYQYESTKAQH